MTVPTPDPKVRSYTALNGCPVEGDPQRTQRIGNQRQGPLLIQDINLIENLFNITNERIPERLVHAKGTGAHGVFECTTDMTGISNANFLSAKGKQTPLFCRFSTVAGRAGSADSVRDTRGFAFKLYTDGGNLDWLFFSEPVFPIRDGGKFPSFVHCQKGRPDSGTFDPNTFWTFMNANPETFHALLMIFSDRGTPKGYEYSEIFGLNTYKFTTTTNGNPVYNFVKIHMKPVTYPVENLSRVQAMELAGQNPDAFNASLWQAIEDAKAGKGAGFPKWDVFMQLIPPDKAPADIYDPTRVISQKDFPLIPFGTITLTSNPTNNFSEVEMVSFNPTAIVPGWNISADPILQTRLFAYGATARHRLGSNFMQHKINRPKNAWNPTRRDGECVIENDGSTPNYIPGDEVNVQIKQGPIAPLGTEEWTGKIAYYNSVPTPDDYVQPRDFWLNVLSQQPGQQDALVDNLASVLCKITDSNLANTIGK